MIAAAYLKSLKEKQNYALQHVDACLLELEKANVAANAAISTYKEAKAAFAKNTNKEGAHTKFICTTVGEGGFDCVAVMNEEKEPSQPSRTIKGIHKGRVFKELIHILLFENIKPSQLVETGTLVRLLEHRLGGDPYTRPRSLDGRVSEFLTAAVKCGWLEKEAQGRYIRRQPINADHIDRKAVKLMIENMLEHMWLRRSPYTIKEMTNILIATLGTQHYDGWHNFRKAVYRYMIDAWQAGRISRTGNTTFMKSGQKSKK